MRQDVAGGQALLAGKPPLQPVAVHHIGGLWDVIERRFVGESVCPVIWYVGRRQCAFLLEVWRNPLSGHRSLLVSAEGGGKTMLMSQALWAFILATAQLGIFGNALATAPTHARLDTYVETVCKQAIVDSPHDIKPTAFGTLYTATKDLRVITGHQILFRATKKASAATGSPIQGQTALGAFDDELQDTVENGADPDIEARLRGARNSRRVCTATAKDSSDWRTFRDAKATSSDWTIERIRYNENPFVWPEHWERLQRSMSLREWQRRGLAMDVGPERMLYSSWDREQNVRPVPQIGAVDVTRSVLSGYAQNADVLVGHDPGTLFDVSILLKAYQLRGRAQHDWWVVGEVTTEHATTEAHVIELLKVLRSKWSCNLLDMRNRPLDGSAVALVRADPYGNTDTKTDKTVYTQFKQQGLDIRPAVYAANNVTAGRVPKEARIEMMSRLFCNAAGDRRLFVACDERREPVARRFVESVEMSQRDESGKAEAQKKDARDLSHWTTAAGYGLYVLEKPRMGAMAGVGR